MTRLGKGRQRDARPCKPGPIPIQARPVPAFLSKREGAQQHALSVDQQLAVFIAAARRFAFAIAINRDFF